MKIKRLDELEIVNGEIMLTLPLDIMALEFRNQGELGITFWFGDPESGVLPKNHVFTFRKKGEDIGSGYMYFGSISTPKIYQIFRKGV